MTLELSNPLSVRGRMREHITLPFYDKTKQNKIKRKNYRKSC